MIRSARLTLILLIALLMLARAAPTGGSGVAQSGSATEILQLVNDFRATLGLPALPYNVALASAAQRQADWIASTTRFSHNHNGSTPKTRAAAAGYDGFVVENIVGGTNMTSRQGLIWWQNSPVHYNTLVTSRYVEAGTGFASNGSQNMYVLVVGRPPNANEVASAPNEDVSAAPIIVPPFILSEPHEDGGVVHSIQQGQALWTVAAYYDVSLDHLYLINGFGPNQLIRPGDEVVVHLPDGQSPPPTATPPSTHLVREGQSAWTIASLHGIELETLLWLNSLSPDSFLQPGDELFIRLAEGQSPPPTPTPQMTHIVQEGQSAWSIAARYGFSVERLLALNGLESGVILRPGDELLIRESGGLQEPAGTPSAPALVEINPTPEATQTNQPTAIVVPTLTARLGGPTQALQTPLATGTFLANSANPDVDDEEGPSWTVLILLGISILVGGTLILARGKRFWPRRNSKGREIDR